MSATHTAEAQATGSGNHVEVSPLASYLANRDVACPACGQNLRGLTSERCSECGSVLGLAVSVRRTGHGWWAMALIANVVGMLYFVIMMSVVSFLALEYFEAGELVVIGAAFGATAWCGAVVGWLVVRAADFARYSPWKRRLVGLLCLMSPPAAWAAWLASMIVLNNPF